MAVKTCLAFVACLLLVENANAAVTLIIESKTISRHSTAVSDSLMATVQITGPAPQITGYEIPLVLSGPSGDVKFTGVVTPTPYLLDPSTPSTPTLTDDHIRIVDSIAPVAVPLTNSLLWSVRFEADPLAKPGDYVIAADPLLLPEIFVEIADSIPVVLVEGTITVIPEPSRGVMIGASLFAPALFRRERKSFNDRHV